MRTGPVLGALIVLLGGGSARAQAQRPQPFTGAAAAAPVASGALIAVGRLRFTGTSTSTPASAPAPPDAGARAGRLRPLAVAKWVALGGAVAAAAVGYDANRVADSRYQELDRICQSNPVRCLPRLPGGQYADAELESRYQDVRRLDRRATFGLAGAEVGVAAALGLFLLDLRHAGREPPDIPYKPPQLEVGPSRSGGMEVRLQLRR